MSKPNLEEIQKRLKSLRSIDESERRRQEEIRSLEDQLRAIQAADSEQERKRRLEAMITERDHHLTEWQKILGPIQKQFEAWESAYEEGRKLWQRAYAVNSEIRRIAPGEGDLWLPTFPPSLFAWLKKLKFLAAQEAQPVPVFREIALPPDAARRARDESLGPIPIESIPPQLFGNPLWDESRAQSIGVSLDHEKNRLLALVSAARKEGLDTVQLERSLHIVRSQSKAATEHPEVLDRIEGNRRECMHVAIGRIEPSFPVDKAALLAIMGVNAE